ncbi:MAG: hypothetical protein JST11_21460 [Acidobacteria bacterium]|nr:hypothetical protein [Acidobacteriota bacterium]
MDSQRWGAFSVIDHIDAGALAADVLLYDKLMLPVPPDEAEIRRWEKEQWQPGLQKQRLDLLGDLAEPIAWNTERQQVYQREMDRLREAGVKVNGYHMTGMVLAGESVDVVAAYHSADAFRKDYPEETEADKKAFLAYLLGQKFAVPKGDKEEALKKAVKVARLPEFQEHRFAMYDWQQKVIVEGTPPEDAVRRMDLLLARYNRCVEKAVKDVYYKFAFTLAGVALSLAAAPANPLAAGGALLAMTRFSAMESRPAISAGPNGPSAMFHDFENIQKPFWDWTKHK